MSAEDLNLITNILTSLQDSNNTLRREAEKQLEVMQNDNIAGLVFLLSNVTLSKLCFNL